ncbi:membrane-associated protein, putative [Bodo saltans]|uniref:Membrane-associated protein, putative n=1 Tax=Bodo saltans TaxID=75058 RepID=A0A0S4ILA3_BODSA|nr:membrane-associated protein, putative [Bodo saltans]|eukprot:CUE70479.1 membrane-associated protein, putative [Bodo saltans]
MRNRSTLSLWTYRCLLMLQGACSVTAAVMVACRLDRVITVNWFVIAFPMGAGVFAAALQLMMRDHLDKDHGVMFVVMLAGIVTGVPLATIIMILSMLEGSGVKLVYAFSPIFGMIAFTLIFVCFCFALCLCDPLTTYIHAQACSSIPMHATARLTNDTYDESDEEEFLQLSTPAMSDDAHEGRLSQHEEYLLC